MNGIQFSSITQSCPTLCNPMKCSMRGLPVHHQLPELTQTHLHWVSDSVQPCHPLLSPSPPKFNLPQHQGIFQWVSSYIRWPKYCSFSFNISPSSEHPGLISFRMDWLDLLIVQGTLKSLLQHHSSKASILWHSAFFIVQLSHPYVTTGKTIALIRQTFVDKVMSLFFNKLSMLVIAFLPRSKHLLILWQQSPSAVIFSPIQFSRSVVSDSLRPLESQHTRPPCPSPTPGVYSNSCPSSWWCHPAISSSVVPFSSCPQSLPASGSFPMSQLFAWGGQSIGVSAVILDPPPK